MSTAGVQVELKKVQRSFDRAVLSDLDLRLEAGEFVSLLGPSGCGKSTLLRLIAGLDRPDRGAIVYGAGNYVRGFVFQEAQLLPWRTVLGNVMLPLVLMKRSREEAERRAREVLAQVGLSDALGKFPAQLSGGMKMRVSVARALVSSPRLLLLDEPFAALDESTRYRLQEDLRRLWRREGMTVVFVTHAISEAAFLSDRAIVLGDRPARIVLDHKIDLPADRSEALRPDPSYIREVGILTRAFRQGEVR